MGRVLILLVALITMGTAANATILATGALFGASTQTTAICYLYNAGGSTVTVESSQIIQQNHGPITLSSNNCSALAAGAICAISANIVNNVGHACKFVISPDGAEVRGTLLITAPGPPFQALATEPLR
jgi:hypothetical protein